MTKTVSEELQLGTNRGVGKGKLLGTQTVTTEAKRTREKKRWKDIKLVERQHSPRLCPNSGPDGHTTFMDLMKRANRLLFPTRDRIESVLMEFGLSPISYSEGKSLEDQFNILGNTLFFLSESEMFRWISISCPFTWYFLTCNYE